MKTVSVIIPCYNEEATIGLLLEAICGQTYPREFIEVIIADGISTDQTRNVINKYVLQYPGLFLKIVDNPRRIIPAALNTAIRASTGEIILRLDAHSIPRQDYIERSVKNLELGLGDNVGGVWMIEPGGEGWMAKSISLAAAHPLGVGDAMYRLGTSAGVVDTVPFGAFYRSTLEQVGGYDESLLTNEDYELNTRIRMNGRRVYLDPEIRSVYYARANLAQLAHQYWRYGYWKYRMLKRYPSTLRWRQAIPPVFVLGILILILAGIWLPVARWFLLGGLLFYIGVLMATSITRAIKGNNILLILGVPLAIATMHCCWGSGFLWSLATSIFEPRKRS